MNDDLIVSLFGSLIDKAEADAQDFLDDEADERVPLCTEMGYDTDDDGVLVTLVHPDGTEWHVKNACLYPCTY